MDGENAVCTQHRVLLSLNKEGSSAMSTHTDGPCECHAKWNELHSERQILHEWLHADEGSKIVKFIKPETGQWWPGAAGWGWRVANRNRLQWSRMDRLCRPAAQCSTCSQQERSVHFKCKSMDLVMCSNHTHTHNFKKKIQKKLINKKWSGNVPNTSFRT